MRGEIYLDNAATSGVAPDVLEAMMPYFGEKFGNPSSLHAQGQQAREAVARSRAVIAAAIGARPDEIIFTSGGTESNNFAVKGVAFANRKKGNHIITSSVEHKCIMNSCKWLEGEGFAVTYLPVDGKGFVSLADLRDSITGKTILVSIIHGNNETGTINDVGAMGALCRERGVPFHTDACQSFGKTDIDVAGQNVDLMTINSHKINGPKGVGALFVRKGVAIAPLLHGGGQESGRRGGTENVPGIVGFAKATQLAMEPGTRQRMAAIRDRMIGKILKIPGTRLNGPEGERRLCNNVNVSIAGIEGESIGGMLNEEGIRTSTGSACSEANLEPSHVLRAMGLGDEECNGSLRISLGRNTTEEDADAALEALTRVVEKLRRISPFGDDNGFVHGKNH
jgi:cysteine desulfurase